MSVKSVFLQLTKLWLRGGRWVVMIGCLIFFAWCYVKAFQTQSAGSPNIGEHERMYLNAAIETRHDLTPDFSKSVSQPLNDWLPHRTDGVVRPLWPWLAAWKVKAEQPQSSGALSAEDFRVLRSGKRWLMGLSLGFLLMLGLAAARAFSVPAALLTILTIGFGVLLPSAAEFSPDVLFQLLFLMIWVCCVAALKRNSLWLYGFIGFFSALANLTLPTATTLVLVFIAVSTLRWLWGWILAHLPHEGGGTSLWVWRNHWLGMILLVVCHLITVGPMLSYSKEKLNDAAPFYWRWFENESAMQQWTALHRTRDTLQAVPVVDRPSYANYVATHTPEAVQARLTQGGVKMTEEVLQFPWNFDSLPHERGVFVIALASILFLLLVIIAFVAPRAAHAGQALHPETAPLVFFSVLACVACTLDFGWDLPVLTWGNRHLSLYPPLVLSLLWASESLVHRARRREMRLPVFVMYEIVLWALCVLAFMRVIAVLQPVAFAA